MPYLSKKIIIGFLSAVLFGGILLVPASPTFAAKCESSDILCFANPLTVNSPADLINVVISAFLGLIGSIALIVFIYGGIMWMTSEGEPEKIKKGLDTMIWAGIGLGIIFASYALVKFVITAII